MNLISDHAAVRPQRLAVDPRPVRSGEEGNRGGDIFRLSQPLERRELRESLVIASTGAFVPA